MGRRVGGCRRKPNALRCSASSFSERHYAGSPKSDDVVELPLFPLPLVASSTPTPSPASLMSASSARSSSTLLPNLQRPGGGYTFMYEVESRVSGGLKREKENDEKMKTSFFSFSDF
ncbi:hypothetical protein L484_018724 [Morus notabilis]|uniref:Uncharacterized protein n=1 Tax=Morus notabilis TaxID=981085 RepID=W9RGM2_9ROSA|nr:hypothetical protein L484_018724 [Morus notabilis]